MPKALVKASYGWLKVVLAFESVYEILKSAN